MKILVDTCIWSQALRRKKPDVGIEERLREIIQDGKLLIIGPIRQEILSGITKDAQFKNLRDHLEPFEDIPLISDHFVRAAEFCNICMKNGIQGSHTDFLLCAVANLEKARIFTVDNDFTMYKRHLPIELYQS